MNAPNGAPRTSPPSALRRLRSGGQAAPGLFALTAAAVAGSFDRAAIASVVESLRVDVWLTDARLGGLFAASTVAAVVLAPAFTALATRRGTSRAVALGLAVAAAGTTLSGAARRGVALLGARIASGAGPAARDAAPGSVLGAAAPGPAVIWGAAAGYGITAVLSRVVGWRWALAMAGLPGVVACIAWLRVQSGAVAAVPGVVGWRGERGLRAELRRLRADRDRLLAVVAQGAATFAAAVTAFWTPAFLERTRGVPRAVAGLEFGVVVLMAGLAGAFASGRAVERLRGRMGADAERWVAGAAALAAAPLAVMAYAGWRPRTYLVGLVLSQLLLFVAVSAGAAALAATVGGPTRMAAAAAVALAMLAQAPGPWLVGLLSDRTSLGRALAVLAPLALAGAGAAWLSAASRAGRARRPSAG